MSQGPLTNLSGVQFFKMTGSGNDFVFFDGREIPRALVTAPDVVAAICNRHNGIGADGVVVLEPRSGTDQIGVHYFNSDGTPADLCGNASLCSTALAATLGMGAAAGMQLATGAGLISSRLGILPEIRLQPVLDVQAVAPITMAAEEQRIGFALAGVPHLVVLCDDAERVDLPVRGRDLRWHPAVGPAGANVNWVSPLPGGTWRYRTFERGVEGETLACGTGAVATAVLLTHWGLAPSGAPVTIRTSSGRDLEVEFQGALGAASEALTPVLRGEGRIVFRGQIVQL